MRSVARVSGTSTPVPDDALRPRCSSVEHLRSAVGEHLRSASDDGGRSASPGRLRSASDDHRRSSWAGRARRLVASLLVLVASSVALTLPAGAGAATPTATVARELQRSPLFVDPAFADTFAPAAQVRLARSARKAPGRPRIMVVPLEEDDQYSGKPENLVAAVRSRLPAEQRDGVFVAADRRYLRVLEFRDGQRALEGPVDDAQYLANYADDEDGESFDRTYVEHIELFLRNLRRSPADLKAAVAADQKAQEKRSAENKRKYGSSRGSSGSGDGGGAGWVVPVVVLLVVGIAVAVGLRRVRRSRRGATPAHGPLPIVPDKVFEHALAAQRADLAEDADGELLALAALLDEAPVPTSTTAQDAYQRALDAYTSARRRMTSDAPTVDLVGVLVLVDHARDHLARAAALDAGRTPERPRPLCFFHPLHGRSARTVAWRDGLRVPACAACASDLRAGRTPDALRDGDRPYFEADTVWARTGYGAFDDDLVGRVARGDR